MNHHLLLLYTFIFAKVGCYYDIRRHSNLWFFKEAFWLVIIGKAQV